MKPLAPIELTQADIDRFWSHVDRSAGPDACWPWMRGCFPNGYGAFYTGSGSGGTKKAHLAHRVAYTIVVGDPAPLLVLHHCDNRPCCNPSVKHLFTGTHRDNMQDMISKNRQAPGWQKAHHGEDHGRAKLTWLEVRAIRTGRNVISRTKLAAQYGVSVPLIDKIMQGDIWVES